MSATEVATRYFRAVGARDLDEAVDCWAPGGEVAAQLTRVASIGTVRT